jgi:hypothetical protein
VCGGRLVDPRPISVCGACNQSLTTAGAISLNSTAEFAAVTPSEAASILNDPLPRAAALSGVSCTWCGKGQDQVRKLLSGGGAHICNECVALCSDILDVEMPDWR